MMVTTTATAMDVMPTSAASTPLTSSQKPRRGSKKTRTGCLTCKIRRVKCDETKPCCLRCTRFGRTCDGYAPLKPSVGTDPSPSSSSSQSKPTTLILPRPTPINIYSPLLLPGTATERGYFSLFTTTTSHALSGVFPNEFWTRLVLQTALQEECIRYAVQAIAALWRGFEGGEQVEEPVEERGELTGQHTRLRDKPRLREDERHREFALEQYTRAVGSLRERLSGQGKGKGEGDRKGLLRTALMACLLFVCIEGIQGDAAAASRQVHSGLSLLTQAHRMRLKRDLHLNQSRAHSGPYDVATYDAGVIEEQILQMWARQNIQSYYLIFAQAPHHPPVLPEHLLEEHRHVFSASMPRFFTHVGEAKRVLDLLLNATAQFHQFCGALAAGEGTGTEMGGKGVSGKATGGANGNGIKTANSAEKVRRYAEHHARLRQWEAAFRPLLGREQTAIGDGNGIDRGIDMDTGSSTRILLLSVYHRVALIILAGAVRQEETMYDSLFKDFKYIVSTMGTILSLSSLPSPSSSSSSSSSTPLFSSGKRRYVFDTGLVPPLHIVASKCRNKVLRREAITLLGDCPLQEGLWAPIGASKTCEWLMELEEKEAERLARAEADANAEAEAERRVDRATHGNGGNGIVVENGGLAGGDSWVRAVAQDCTPNPTQTSTHTHTHTQTPIPTSTPNGPETPRTPSQYPYPHPHPHPHPHPAPSAHNNNNNSTPATRPENPTATNTNINKPKAWTATANAEASLIPEAARVRLSGMRCEFRERRMWVQCTGTVPVAGGDGSARMEETVVWW